MEPFYQALHYAVTGDPRVFGHHAGITQHGFHMATAMASAHATGASVPPIHGSRSSCSASPAIGSSSAKPPPLANFPESNSRNTATVPPMPHHSGYYDQNRCEQPNNYHTLRGSVTNGGTARNSVFRNSLTSSDTTSLVAVTQSNSGFAEALRQLAKQVGNDPITERNPFITIGGANRESIRDSYAQKYQNKNNASVIVSESLMYPNCSSSLSRVAASPANHPPIVTIAPSQRRSSSNTALAGSEYGFQPYSRGSNVLSGSQSVAPSSSTSTATSTVTRGSANWSEHLMLAQLYNGLMNNGAAEASFFQGGSSGNNVSANAAAMAAANYQAQQLAAIASAGGSYPPGGGEMAAALWYQRLIQQATLAAAGVAEVQSGASSGSATWQRAAATSQQHQQAAASAAAVAQMEMMQQYMLAFQQHQQQQSAAAAVMQGLMLQQNQVVTASASTSTSSTSASSASYGAGVAAAAAAGHPTALLAAASGGGRTGVELRRQNLQSVKRNLSSNNNNNAFVKCNSDTTISKNPVEEAVVLDLSQTSCTSKTKELSTCQTAKVKFYRPFEPSPPPLLQEVPRLNSTLALPEKNSTRFRLDSLLMRRQHALGLSPVDEMSCSSISATLIGDLKCKKKRQHFFTDKAKSESNLHLLIKDGGICESPINEFLIDPPNALSDALCRGHDYLEKKRFFRSMALQPLSRQAKRERDGRRRRVDSFVKRLHLQAFLHSFSPDQLLKSDSMTASKSAQGLNDSHIFNDRRFHSSVLKMSSWCDKKPISVDNVHLNAALCTVDVV